MRRVDALLAALKADDDAALVAIFGDKHKTLIVTPDRAANSGIVPRLAAAMQTYRLLEEQGKDRRVLLIGDQAWPLPIPLVRVGERWRFATEEGEDEIVNRRIGANERSAIKVLRAYLDAQKDYAARDRDGDGVLQYAQRLGSTPGKHDGLYWPADTAKGEEASPFGPLVAESAAYLKGHQRRRSVPRLSLPDSHAPGQERARRRVQLRHQRAHDRRLRDGGVSRPVWR